MIPRYSREQMTSLFSDETKWNLWLQVEVQALKSRAALKQLPPEVAERVARSARISPARVAELEKTLKHDVLAFLTVLKESISEDDARHVHFGMTSSDVLDTALALQCRDGLDALEAEVTRLVDVCLRRAEEFRGTVCVARTHGIHAEPSVFGLTFLLWASDFSRWLQRLQSVRTEIAVGKLSGAVGTGAHLGLDVEEHFCQALKLRPEPVATQVVQRDRHASLAYLLGLLGSLMEKVSVELRHWQRTEVREAEEPFAPGQKGSSAMPHKRNPIAAENLTGCARMLRSYVSAALENVALWHERDISHSSVERVFLPDAFILADYAIVRLRDVVDGLVVHQDNIAANVELTRGLIYSQRVLLVLTEAGLDRDEAYRLVQEASFQVWKQPGSHLKAVLVANASLVKRVGKVALETAFDPRAFLQEIPKIYARVLEGIRATQKGR